MPASAPLISIVVVCRDPGPDLPLCLDSVWSQDCESGTYELVVIDGASRDGTAAWLSRQASRLGHLLSEPDDGVYAAMNKGVAAARGAWILFLGADDRLADEHVLQHMATHLRSSEAGLVSAQARYSDGRLYASCLPLRPVQRNPLHHQCTFYRRSMLPTPTTFDPSLRIAADYDLNLRLLLSEQSVETVPTLISHCRSGGLSDAGHWITYREEITVRRRHFPFGQRLLWDIFSVLRFLRKKVHRLLRPV
ncbi:glycosyltransferase family 2 protein [Actomonas aquatica]|uniref:Glycosyltransferase family 2 protein n=1 Tax=Actomonas aquatica TaxID=2866162 RepID=A0ABZ1CAH3_9BACT|nr:glycosyltransferase family 2 protein [Opitutus sp. WL0086]WRQ88397.1 glycosyltransferase family 2 protein [Opitutus sp. WL0086]